MSSRNYKQIIFKLLPRGTIFPNIGGLSEFEKLITGIAVEATRADCEAEDLLSEIMPDSTGRFLTDWERIMGLPICATDQTVEERRDTVIAMLNLGPYSNEAFFEGIAAIFGFTATATVMEAFRAGSSGAGDPLNGEAQQGTIVISSECTNPIYFRAGTGQAGDPLITCANESLECLINFFKLSFQHIIFEYV